MFVKPVRLPHCLTPDYTPHESLHHTVDAWGKSSQPFFTRTVGKASIEYAAIPALAILASAYHLTLAAGKTVFFTLEIPVRVLSGAYLPYFAKKDISFEEAGCHVRKAANTIVEGVFKQVLGPNPYWTKSTYSHFEDALMKSHRWSTNTASILDHHVFPRLINCFAIPILSAIGALVHSFLAAAKLCLFLAQAPFEILSGNHLKIIARDEIEPTQCGLHLRMAVKHLISGIATPFISVGSTENAFALNENLGLKSSGYMQSWKYIPYLY